MKCSKHQAEAIGVCTYCGRAMCVDCVTVPSAARLTCSEACAASLARQDTALDFLVQKSVQNARANAFYCYLCGGLSGVGAVVAYFIFQVPFLVLFMAGCAVVLVISGYLHTRASRRQIKE